MIWSIKKIKNDSCVIDIPANIFDEKIRESLKEQIIELSDDDCKIFYLNLHRITKVNSKALASIIAVYELATRCDIEVKLFNLQPYVSDLIYQTRLNQIFDICDLEHSIYTETLECSVKTA